MLRLTIIMNLLFCLASCSGSDNKPTAIDNRTSPSKPANGLEENSEVHQKIVSCTFDNPDTSLSSLNLRDPESATSVLKGIQLNGDTAYNFHSIDRKENLRVTIHAGDGESQISIFQVSYAGNSKGKVRSIPIEHFSTEKGIKLGLDKSEVVANLGPCYVTSDSSKNTRTIIYRLETPQDSRTKLLERQNMPIYYGIYTFRNDKLVELEFGFEYP